MCSNVLLLVASLYLHRSFWHILTQDENRMCDNVTYLACWDGLTGELTRGFRLRLDPASCSRTPRHVIVTSNGCFIHGTCFTDTGPVKE